MATSEDYIKFVVEQIERLGSIRYKKMFGEYMVYADDKPIMLVCDNEVFVKKLEPLQELMKGADVGTPYNGAKEHYILDIEDSELVPQVVEILKQVTPVPKPRKKKSQGG